jgi:hypothetical protein
MSASSSLLLPALCFLGVYQIVLLFDVDRGPRTPPALVVLRAEAFVEDDDHVNDHYYSWYAFEKIKKEQK